MIHQRSGNFDAVWPGVTSTTDGIWIGQPRTVSAGGRTPGALPYEASLSRRTQPVPGVTMLPPGLPCAALLYRLLGHTTEIP